MKIVIAHLYYDLLNLYGESGNVKALKRYLENQNIEVEVRNVTLFDNIKFEDYDFIYIGMGTENNLIIALEHLIQYRKDINKYIQEGGFLIATGNSLELFGQYIVDKENKKYPALDIFSYYSVFAKKRIVCESIMKEPNLEMPIIGFQNRSSMIENNKKAWLRTIKNYKPESNPDIEEGVHFKNFYGTYLLGPILARNPHFLEKVAKTLIINKDAGYIIEEVDLSLEFHAYETDRKRYEEK